MSDDEVVLGVLKRCEVCDEKTLHVDGVCQDHRVVRRKKRAVAAPRPVARRPRSRWKRSLALLLLGALLIGVMGATHVTYGDRSGIHVCWKDGWSLQNTFVNSDADHPDLVLLKRCAP